MGPGTSSILSHEHGDHHGQNHSTDWSPCIWLSTAGKVIASSWAAPHSLLPAKSSLPGTLLELHGSHAAILWVHHLPVQQEETAKAQKKKVHRWVLRVCMQCGRLGMWCLSLSRRPVDKDADGISQEKRQPAGHSQWHDWLERDLAAHVTARIWDFASGETERFLSAFLQAQNCSLHPRAWWPCFRQASETGAFLPLVVLIFPPVPCSHGR